MQGCGRGNNRRCRHGRCTGKHRVGRYFRPAPDQPWPWLASRAGRAWQFFVDDFGENRVAVSADHPRIAETIRLATDKRLRVRVPDNDKGKVICRARVGIIPKESGTLDEPTGNTGAPGARAPVRKGGRA